MAMRSADDRRGSAHRLLLAFAASLAVWLAVCLVDSTWFYFTALSKGAAMPYGEVLRINTPYWLVAAVLTVPVIWLTRRFPFSHGRQARAAVVHALAVVPFAVFHVFASRGLRMLSDGFPIPLPKLMLFGRKTLSTTFDKEILLYVVIVGAVSAFDYYRQYRDKERAAAALELEQARLEACLSEARLDALKAQLQPHFLFNALHAISTLILRGDAEAANQMLQHLSDFLRMALDSGDAAVVPLSQELELLEAYLRIQRARFGDRLRVDMEIDAGARSAMVPSLILQPLVENAIRHGIGSDPGQGVIAVRARRAGDRLELQVEDDGEGLREDVRRTEGVGLANIRARLEHLYPGSHAFGLGRADSGGTLAKIVIPHRMGRDGAADPIELSVEEGPTAE
jgi:two-component sensor histidine kinase